MSYNNLEGPIPTSSQLQSFNSSAFEGNLKFCGAQLPNDVDANTNSQDVDNGDQIPWFHFSIVLGFIIGFCGVCGPLMFKKNADMHVS